MTVQCVSYDYSLLLVLVTVEDLYLRHYFSTSEQHCVYQHENWKRRNRPSRCQADNPLAASRRVEHFRQGECYEGGREGGVPLKADLVPFFLTRDHFLGFRRIQPKVKNVSDVSTTPMHKRRGGRKNGDRKGSRWFAIRDNFLNKGYQTYLRRHSFRRLYILALVLLVSKAL